MTELSKMLQEYYAGERGMPTYDELAALLDKPLPVRVFQSAEQNEQLARDAQAILDAEMRGIGFLVDGVSIHPSRVTVLRPAATAQVVADERDSTLSQIADDIEEAVSNLEGDFVDAITGHIEAMRAAIAAAPVQATFDISTPMHFHIINLDGMLLNYRCAATPEKAEEFKSAILKAISDIAAPVQAQEPVAYVWSVNGMVKTGGDSVFDDHEKFYRAPVQPVAVPDSFELAFNAKRLRRTAILLGLAKSIPPVDGELMGCLGAVLGMICREVEKLIAAPAAQGAGATFARQLIDSGAENYIGEVFDTERGDIEVTARYVSGKTPADRLAEIEASIAAAQGDAKELTDEQLTVALQGIYHSDFQDDSNGYDLAIARAAIAAKAAS